MRPDKVKTITSVMKPLLGRGDNERIFWENLVSINHVDPHIIANHCAALMFCPTPLYIYRLILHAKVWSAKTGPALKSAEKCVSAPTRRVFYAGHGDQISPMLRCLRKWKCHRHQATGQSKAQYILQWREVKYIWNRQIDLKWMVFVIYSCPAVNYCTIKSWMRKQLKLM